MTARFLPSFLLLAACNGPAPADTDAVDTDATDTDVTDTDVADTDVADTDVADTDVADTDTSDTDDTDAPDGWEPKEAASVFFSGHSLINLNTPSYFAQVADRAGRTVDYELQMGLGSPMSVRLACPKGGQQADGNAIAYDLFTELARADAYDTLIVTERHDIVDTLAYESSTAMARHFRDLFLSGSPDGQPLLFESWYTIDSTDPAAFQARVAEERIAWECVASKVNQSRGSSRPMLVVPAGQALAELVGDVVDGTAPGLTTLDQVFADDVHLTAVGDWFVAMIHYGVTYRRSSVGLAHDGLTPMFGSAPSMSADTAAYLQALADRWAQRTWLDAADAQRTDAECEPLIEDLCAARYGASAWICSEIVSTYRNDTAPIPVITDDWCQR